MCFFKHNFKRAFFILKFVCEVFFYRTNFSNEIICKKNYTKLLFSSPNQSTESCINNSE